MSDNLPVSIPPMLMHAQMRAEAELSGWLLWPRDEFERYVRAMPQSEAQTALIFLVNFIQERVARSHPISSTQHIDR